MLLSTVLTACPSTDEAGREQAAAPSTAAAEPHLKVVCTTGMLADAARIIGGERADVFGMMGPGVDPHLYKARESDVLQLYDADLVIYNGLHLEARLGSVLEKMGSSRLVVAATDGIPAERLLAVEDDLPDPHVWFDVELWQLVVERIAAAYGEADPPRAAEYQGRAADYRVELDELQDYVESVIGVWIPGGNRILITGHDAFGYFGRAYGFEVYGLQGISTAAEAGTADVQALVDLIVERHVAAIFVESSVPERNIQAVQEAVRSRGWEVEIGGELFSDALGDAGTPEGTYLGMVRHNIDTIARGLRHQPGDDAYGE